MPETARTANHKAKQRSPGRHAAKTTNWHNFKTLAAQRVARASPRQMWWQKPELGNQKSQGWAEPTRKEYPLSSETLLDITVRSWSVHSCSRSQPPNTPLERGLRGHNRRLAWPMLPPWGDASSVHCAAPSPHQPPSKQHNCLGVRVVMAVAQAAHRGCAPAPASFSGNFRDRFWALRPLPPSTAAHS
jgi:hypothetical protein